MPATTTLDTTIDNPLDDNEADALTDAEQIIERGLATFVEVGDALSAIRDGRLYRLSHTTFEDYCRERWGMSRQRAHQYVESAETVAALSTMVDTPKPASERQARALAPLKKQPEKMAEAMESAAAATDGKPTAQAITDAVTEIVDRELRTEAYPAKPPKPVKPRRQSITDDARRAAWDLEKATAKVEQLLADDRAVRHVDTLNECLGTPLANAAALADGTKPTPVRVRPVFTKRFTPAMAVARTSSAFSGLAFGMQMLPDEFEITAADAAYFEESVAELLVEIEVARKKIAANVTAEAEV